MRCRPISTTFNVSSKLLFPRCFNDVYSVGNVRRISVPECLIRKFVVQTLYKPPEPFEERDTVLNTIISQHHSVSGVSFRQSVQEVVRVAVV